MSQPLSFVALGSVWLDEIRVDDVLRARDVPGGSVVHATLGARMLASGDPRSIALVFNAGHDFPGEVLHAFSNWGLNMDIRTREDAPSARGIVSYVSNDSNRKSFRRLTQPLPIKTSDLKHTPMIDAQTFHIFGSAGDIVEQFASGIFERRACQLVIWEPSAKSCLPTTLLAHQQASAFVNVFSPNHVELGFFFTSCPASEFNRAEVERQALLFHNGCVAKGRLFLLVVRAAEHGCLIVAADSDCVWLPAFHPAGSNAVVDPTGAGNAFLGAFSIGLQKTGDAVTSAMYGNVAASLAIEQIGLPRFAREGNEETWNGVRVEERIAVYERRLRHV